jgi:hypothetical protein
VIEVRNVKYIVSIVLIILLFLATYIYFTKEPVESKPSRATLVFIKTDMEVAV